MLTENDRQELSISYVLNRGADDPSRLLKKFLVAPVGIQRGQFRSDPVVQS